MALEIPHALIHKLQLSIREAAGLQHYDPDDPSVNNFPSFRDCISSLESSVPADLRCKNCHGTLLRGAESVVCVYCGNEQPRDELPETISFNSTAGCRNLLDFLDFDQSEPVTLHADSRDSGRSEGAIKVMFLSDLLDLKMKWLPAREDLESSMENKTLSRSTPMDFSVGDLDKFIAETKSLEVFGDSSVPQRELLGHAISTKAPLSSESRSFASFENVHSKKLVQESLETTTSYAEDSFADWEADFQSAGSEIPAAHSEALDTVPTSTSEAFNEHSTIDVDVHDNDLNNQSANNVDNHLSINADRNPSDSWQTAGIKPADTNQLREINSPVGKNKSSDFLYPTEHPDEKNNHHNNSSLDVWKDFPSSQHPEGVSFDSWTHNGESNSLYYENPPSDIRALGTSEMNGASKDFTSSQAPQGDLPIMDFLNVNNSSKEIDFGNFLQPASTEISTMKVDNLTDTSEDKEFGSFLETRPTGSKAFENEYGKVNIQIYAASSERGEVTRGADKLSVDNIETQGPQLVLENLLSQMSDLSFMLSNDLSIPQNQDTR